MANSSNVLEHLSTSFESHPYTANAYVYISFKDQTTLDLSTLMLQIVAQLLAARPDTPSSLSELEKCFDGGRTPTNILLKKVLKDVTEGFPHCYLIIDGIDECPNPEDAASHWLELKGRPRQELLQLIVELRRWGLPSLHLFVSSRPNDDIKFGLATVLAMPPATVVDLHTPTHRHMKNDIDKYIKHELYSEFSTFSHLSTDIKTDISERLLAKSDGM